MLTIGACKARQEEYPVDREPDLTSETDYTTEKKASSTSRYNNTGMFLMDNGMILMFGADRPWKYKDSTRYLLHPIVNQPEHGGKRYFHH